MQCELCGKDRNECKFAIVEGVRMMLCSNCMIHGKYIKNAKHIDVNKPFFNRIKKPPEKDIYTGMDKELVPGWNELIKSARRKKGLTREKLGFNIGERTVTISKIENGDLRPSDKIIRKLEKELDVTLVEKVKDSSEISGDSFHRAGLTLGDFLKNK
jgi:putative transcription factor